MLYLLLAYELFEEFRVAVGLHEDDQTATYTLLLNQSCVSDELGEFAHLERTIPRLVPEVEGLPDADRLEILVRNDVAA